MIFITELTCIKSQRAIIIVTLGNRATKTANVKVKPKTVRTIRGVNTRGRGEASPRIWRRQCYSSPTIWPRRRVV